MSERGDEGNGMKCQSEENADHPQAGQAGRRARRWAKREQSGILASNELHIGAPIPADILRFVTGEEDSAYLDKSSDEESQSSRRGASAQKVVCTTYSYKIWESSMATVLNRAMVFNKKHKKHKKKTKKDAEDWMDDETSDEDAKEGDNAATMLTWKTKKQRSKELAKARKERESHMKKHSAFYVKKDEDASEEEEEKPVAEESKDKSGDPKAVVPLPKWGKKKKDDGKAFTVKADDDFFGPDSDEEAVRFSCGLHQSSESHGSECLKVLIFYTPGRGLKYPRLKVLILYTPGRGLKYPRLKVLIFYTHGRGLKYPRLKVLIFYTPILSSQPWDWTGQSGKKGSSSDLHKNLNLDLTAPLDHSEMLPEAKAYPLYDPIEGEGKKEKRKKHHKESGHKESGHKRSHSHSHKEGSQKDKKSKRSKEKEVVKGIMEEEKKMSSSKSKRVPSAQHQEPLDFLPQASGRSLPQPDSANSSNYSWVFIDCRKGKGEDTEMKELEPMKKEKKSKKVKVEPEVATPAEEPTKKERKEKSSKEEVEPAKKSSKERSEKSSKERSEKSSKEKSSKSSREKSSKSGRGE
eukprot:1176352-Prorocentrum_minimum.AAC.1